MIAGTAHLRGPLERAIEELEAVWPAEDGTWRLEGPLVAGIYAAAAIRRNGTQAARAHGLNAVLAILELAGVLRELAPDPSGGARAPRTRGKAHRAAAAGALPGPANP